MIDVPFSKRKWLDPNVNKFLTIHARGCALLKVTTHLTKFQLDLATKSKINIFGKFICSLSMAIVGGEVVLLNLFKTFYTPT